MHVTILGHEGLPEGLSASGLNLSFRLSHAENMTLAAPIMATRIWIQSLGPISIPPPSFVS